MKKNFKRVSAIILAAAMSMSSSVIASAAKMNIYVRDYDQKVTNIYQETSTTPTIVLDTNPGESIYEAIAKGKVASDSNNALTASISSNWNKVTNKDGSIDWYLISMGINNRAKTSFATKTNDNNYTMSDAVCPASDFSIILSYDHSELKW